MKLSWCAAALVTIFVGCHAGSAGGPGADDPTQKPYLRDADQTFTLGYATLDIRQGETKAVFIPIKRARNFHEDVTLTLGELPSGVTVDNSSPKIKHGDRDGSFLVTATNDAALGSFTLRVKGHPTRGIDAFNEVEITVLPRTRE